MDNAHAEVVTQDQEPAGMWDLSRKVVKRVSPDPASPVTTQTATNWPVWEIWAVLYAKAPDIIFLEHSVHFFMQHCSARNQISPAIEEILLLTISPCLNMSNAFQNELVSPARSDQFGTWYIRKFITLSVLEYKRGLYVNSCLCTARFDWQCILIWNTSLKHLAFHFGHSSIIINLTIDYNSIWLKFSIILHSAEHCT